MVNSKPFGNISINPAKVGLEFTMSSMPSLLMSAIADPTNTHPLMSLWPLFKLIEPA